MLPHPPRLLLTLVLCLALAACGGAAPPEAAQEPAPRPATRATPRPSRTPQVATKAPQQPTVEPTTDDPPAAAPTEPPATATPEPTLSATTIVANGGNVRLTPVSGKPLDQVNARESVQLLGKNAAGTWYLLVTPRNVTGWVSATLLTIDPAVVAQVPVVDETAPAVAADSWTTHTVGGSSIQLPPTWRPLALTKEDLERAARAIEGQNPALAANIRKISGSQQFSQIEFFAIDSDANGPGGNINLITVPRPTDVSPNELLERTIAALPQLLPDVKFVSADSKHQVNGLPAGRVIYDLPISGGNGAGTVRGVQWYVVGATSVYVITISGPSSDAFVALADRIGRSFTTNDAAEGAATSGERRQVTNGGNLRREPKVSPANVIGQVCPGDQVVLLEKPAVAGWAAVRIVITGPDCHAQRAAAGTEGWVSTSLLGPLPQDGSASLPPSLLITKLVPFSHGGTGISGLRPDNWTIFDKGSRFQISSSPEAPDGFLGQVIPPSEYPAEGASGLSRSALEALKQNHAAGPPPEVREERYNPDGSGVLLVTISSTAQGSSTPVRSVLYARTTITDRGVLLAVAVVPADLFPQEEALVRQMVDSLKVTDRVAYSPLPATPPPPQTAAAYLR